MAKDAKPAAEGADVAPARKSKKLLIIISVLVLTLGLGGLGAFFLLRQAPEHEDDGDEVAVEKAKPVKKKKADRDAPPVYVALETFTVNLIPENGDQFLQLILSVEVDDPQVGDQLKLYTPKLRNDLTLLLSSKKASELITKEGKQILAQEIRDQINGVLDPGGKGKKRDGPIKEVLFTSFIIQ
ncbi:flagellar basal body-associated FliL family protein [Accumulibacter sp.]|uniref:Flagellar protein FliL n=1 Tax=Candidatus Accumulibacter proximus TaxID=2954385 RepID=A0A935PWB8_9PROT|nr:flagellar basal body-associated FliL family protein [Accumulibacter sp.]MBK7673902.1 flagellar basal body-associated FliL family protein [Candidatus Accumulibacter proximus]MBL8375362.1 flagellar basal body-associated FliL family protein [Accumulibacter sp.]